MLPLDLGGSVEATCSTHGYAAFVGGAPPGSPIALRLLASGSKDWSEAQDPTAQFEGGFPACSRDGVVVASAERRQTTCAVPCALAPEEQYRFARVQRFDLQTRRWSDVPAPPDTRLLAYSTGHGSFVDFLSNDGGPGLRLMPASGTWSPIAESPDFVQFPNAILWTRGLAVVQDLDRVYVYRPV